MSEGIDLATMGAQAVTTVGGAGGVGLFMKWLAGKEAAANSTKLALLEQKIDQLLVSSAKHEGLGERIAIVERDVAAVHRRLDELTRRKR